MAADVQTITSPEDQRASFVELFFDLVFVFSVTQVVDLLHHSFTWYGAGQALLAFWMIWWAWTQLTWTLNAANTDHHLIEFGTLIATGVAFFMAVTLPGAFRGGAIAFAVPYLLVRLLGLALYSWVASENPALKGAIRTFALASVGGLAAVLAGAVAGGVTLYWLWGLAILLDVVAAAVGGQSEGWDLHPDHFCERHGLFVIIALGETLIVAGSGFAGTVWTGDLVGVAVLAVAVTCALWWTYFPRAKPALEHALSSCKGSTQSMMARDAFSLLHFLMVCGIIAYAAAVEDMAAHPGQPVGIAGRLALAFGIALFTGGMAAALVRCGRHLLLPRLLLTAGTSCAVLAVSGVPPAVTLGIALTGIVAIAVQEQRSLHL